MMKYVFSATMSKVNLTYWDNPQRGGEGGGTSIFGAYRYHRPKKATELNVWKNFAARFKYILKGKEIWQGQLGDIDVSNNLKVICGSATELSKYVEEGSIDYVYTDPPYGGNIAYIDLSTMWNAWLGFEVPRESHEKEIIEGGELDKSQDDYEILLTESLKQISKVLKKNAWMSIVFAHKKLEFWNTIIDASENGGLEFKGSTFQPTNNTSVHYKKNRANVLCSQRIASFEKTLKRSERNDR